jgi:hypothetical protein
MKIFPNGPWFHALVRQSAASAEHIGRLHQSWHVRVLLWRVQPCPSDWHTYDRPVGHYAAHLEPQIVARDIRRFFRSFR